MGRSFGARRRRTGRSPAISPDRSYIARVSVGGDVHAGGGLSRRNGFGSEPAKRMRPVRPKRNSSAGPRLRVSGDRTNTQRNSGMDVPGLLYETEGSSEEDRLWLVEALRKPIAAPGETPELAPAAGPIGPAAGVSDRFLRRREDLGGLARTRQRAGGSGTRDNRRALQGVLARRRRRPPHRVGPGLRGSTRGGKVWLDRRVCLSDRYRNGGSRR